jgi:ElaB/YqjD/DUF883 family membrane-anchored ribosome-binding protein
MINPTLSHAERVRLGLTPADPNYMPPAIYNPVAKGRLARRTLEAARGKATAVFADAVRQFSPWELEELRLDLMRLNTLRADRFVALIDSYHAAADYSQHVQGAIEAADLEGLADDVSSAEDNLLSELKAKDDEINELLSDNPESSPAELCAAFRAWHDLELKRLRKVITEELSEISGAVDEAKTALDAIDPLA